MSEANTLFGPILTKALEAKAQEVIFMGNSVPMFRFAEDDTRVLDDAEPITLKELRIALNSVGGVELGFESVHEGWYQHDGQKFDLTIFHEPDRTGASFRYVGKTDEPDIEKTEKAPAPVDHSISIPDF